DPWGRIVIEGGETPMLLTAEIELDEIQEVRETIPVFEDIRKDIFDF
ncbi:MAG: carbon-nitrogen family hydrolase, partial [Chloroflexi bacterium]